MKTKKWAVCGVLTAVVAIGVAGTLLERVTAAQAARPQVPLFEPDPLWSQA